jgi:hypothetical protein
MDYTALQILSRKQLVQLLTKYYQLNFLKPTLHSVPLTNGYVATVSIFDFKALLIAFLNDPLRMHQENFASNYIIFTGKATLQTLLLMKYTLDHFGSRLDKNTVVMIHMHFPENWYAFMIKQILMYLVHFHVHHLFVHHHS